MDPIALIQLVCFAAIGIVFAAMAAASVRIGIALIIVASLWEALVYLVPVATVAGTNVYMADGVFGLLAFAMALRLLRGDSFTFVEMLWMAFGCCLVFSWWRGIGAFGLAPATNGFRDFFYLWVGVAYVATFRLDSRFLEVFYRYWAFASAVLFLMAAERRFFPLPTIDLVLSTELDEGLDRIFEGETDWLALRVLTTHQVLMIAQTAVLATILVMRAGRRGLHVFLLLLSLGFVVLMQHRTVWLTTAAMLLLVLFTIRLRGKVLLSVLATAGVTALAVIVAAGTGWLGSTSVAVSLSGAVNEVSDFEFSTFRFRLLLWENYLDHFRYGSLVEHIWGQPFGTVVPSSIQVGPNLVNTEVFPHNFYIYVGFFAGLLGLFLLLWVFADLLRRLWRLKHDGMSAVTARDWCFLLIGLLIYSITYGLQFEQSIVLGVAMSLAKRRRSAPIATARVPLRTGLTQRPAYAAKSHVSGR